MADKKKFRRSLLGFNKKQVNDFIVNTISEYENSFSEKNDELYKLKIETRALQAQMEKVPDLEAKLSTSEANLENATAELKKKSGHLEESLERIDSLTTSLNEMKRNLLVMESSVASERDALKAKALEYEEKLVSLNDERIKVTETLILAHEKADSMIQAAKTATEEELSARGNLLQQEKIRYLDFINFLKAFRSQTSDTFKSLDDTIKELIDNNEYLQLDGNIDKMKEASNIAFPTFQKSTK